MFDHEQRKQHFSFPKALLDIAVTRRNPGGQIGFLLLCGYFKATKRFFLPQDFRKRDIEAAARAMGLLAGDFSPEDYVKTTRIRHQKCILDFYGFKPFDGKAGAILAVEIRGSSSSGTVKALKPMLLYQD